MAALEVTSSQLSLATGTVPEGGVSPWAAARAQLDDDDDPEAARVRACVLARLVGDDVAAIPPRIARFVLLRRLGEGAMGVVWLAHDPELDRRVALKLLHIDREGERARLLREARAMAKLAHPHVAALYEAGTHLGRPYLAMELVDGPTLRQWRIGAQPSWQALLAAHIEAARGLAAAHALGIVHRDFKPDNAIVGADGRVRVVDFGLACRGDAECQPTLEQIDAPRDGADVWTELTGVGGVIGTPAYMAPEQFAGASIDARTDQFAFCVALWEALYGERPFEGDTHSVVADNVAAGRVRAPPPGDVVPRAIARVLRRGLSARPAERHASMDALIRALQRARWSRRRRAASLAAIALSSTLAGVLGWHALGEQQRIRECEAQGAAIAEVWNPAVASTMRAAMHATGARYAEETRAHVTDALDDYARAWQSARTQVCTHEVAVAALRTECLEQRRAALAAWVDELLVADRTTVRHASRAVARLPQLSACLDDIAGSRTPLPLAQRDAERLRTQLARASAATEMGARARAMPLVRDAIAVGDANGWVELAAEARLLLGELLAPVDARAAARELAIGYAAAIRVGATQLALRSAERMHVLLSGAHGRRDEAQRWLHDAQMLLDVLGEGSGISSAERVELACHYQLESGGYDRARSECARALAARIAARGPLQRRIAAMRFLRGVANDLAASDHHLGRMTTKYRSTLCYLIGLSTAACGDAGEPAEDAADEIVENLLAAGFAQDDIEIRADMTVIVGGDAVVGLAASREMIGTDGDGDAFRQYHTHNLVSPSIRRICVDGTALSGVLSDALDRAIANYSRLDLSFFMVRSITGPTCDATVKIYLVDGTGSQSGFPAGGIPFDTVDLGRDTASFGVAVSTHVITHELGHAVGLRHSDFFDRSISGCPFTETAEPDGAVHIPGTPTGAVVNGSVMNACYNAGSTGIWNPDDITALRYLYVGESEDIVWQNTDSRQVHYWQMSRGSRIAGLDIDVPPPVGWNVRGSGDVDGDGTDDVIFQHDDGRVHYWRMQGGLRIGAGDISGPIPATYHLLAVGDVNGDATDDLIWQDDAGQVSRWTMRGGVLIAADTVSTPVAASYHLRGAGDVDGDGTDDLVWQDDAGQVSVWRMRDGVPFDFPLVYTPVAADWHLRGVGDVTGDGTDDLVWQHDFGEVTCWRIVGAVWAGQIDIDSAGAPWRIAGVGDVDR